MQADANTMQPADDGLSREALKLRLEETLRKVASDRALADAVKARGFWAKLFANSTRDLAKASIAQNELISELNLVVQTLARLVARGEMHVREIADLVARPAATSWRE